MLNALIILGTVGKIPNEIMAVAVSEPVAAAAHTNLKVIVGPAQGIPHTVQRVIFMPETQLQPSTERIPEAPDKIEESLEKTTRLSIPASSITTEALNSKVYSSLLSATSTVFESSSTPS